MDIRRDKGGEAEEKGDLFKRPQRQRADKRPALDSKEKREEEKRRWERVGTSKKERFGDKRDRRTGEGEVDLGGRAWMARVGGGRGPGACCGWGRAP